MTDEQTTQGSEKVGFRDIYRAVGESETRIKEHITLVLYPLTSQIAEHTIQIANHEGRLVVVERTLADGASAKVERRRIGDMSGRALALLILGTNFLLGLIVTIANFVTSHS